MSNISDYLTEQKERLSKALIHLDYSYQKILKLSDNLDQLDEESLETWESFAARFSRVADLFLTKYLRALVLAQDPGFTGSLRDFVNQGEKLAAIDNAESWMAIRELRNISAHEYTDKDLAMFFKRLKQECPRLLSIQALLNHHAPNN
jgi:hypothetical protein